MQNPYYAENFDALTATCAERGVAVQTIKSIGAAAVARAASTPRRPGTSRTRTRTRSTCRSGGRWAGTGIHVISPGDVDVLPEGARRRRPASHRRACTTRRGDGGPVRERAEPPLRAAACSALTAAPGAWDGLTILRGVAGPLAGVRVVELAGIGPGPFAAMMLADAGADVVRVERAADVRRAPGRRRTRTSCCGAAARSAVDLKHPDGRQVVLDLVAGADVLLEGFRPGRHRAARARPGRLPRGQPGAGLRPDDRLGPGRSTRDGRPATTSATSRSPGR